MRHENNEAWAMPTCYYLTFMCAALLSQLTMFSKLCTGLRSSCKNEMAPAPELSVFVNMAPAPEQCFFQHGSGWVLLIHINNFGIPSVLLVASERVIPTYFELILLPLPGLGTRKEFGLV